MEIHSVALVGLGALGILFGTPLAQSPDVELTVLADASRVQRYRKETVTFNGEPIHFTYASPEEAKPADLVLFGVKYGALEEAMDVAANAIDEHTILVSLLNGITSEEVLDRRWKGQVLWAVSTDTDATRVGRALTCHARGKIQLGERDGHITPRLEAVTKVLTQAGITIEVREDILFKQWYKLMINVGLNQASAVYDVPYGGLIPEGEARATMIAAMEEVIQLSALEGQPLPKDAVTGWLPLLETFAPDGMPSMRQDVLAKRPTEVELFSGTVLRLGAKHGLSCPVNQMLYDRIRAIESEYIK
jgi:2-dehydropantoate 2-reductase